MFSSYGKLSSEVYDIDKPIGGSYRDVAYYMTRLETCKGTILEPATGTGRMLIPLLEKGLNVEGFDSSKDMLNICENNCKERHLNPKLFEAKMESFSLDKKYDAIILPAGTFLLLYKRADSIKALQNFYKHLSPGGRLIVDISLQTDFPIGMVSTRTWNSSNGDMITLEDKLVEVDYIKQHTISHGRYEKWHNGSLIQTELEYLPLRWYGVEEFKSILEGIGFKDIVISSNRKFGEYPSNPEDTITFEAVADK